VLAVGGTQLTADLSSGAYRGEVAWNDGSQESPAASGGGYSILFGRPRYQAGAVTRNARGLPDVAYSSASNGAVMVYVGQDGTGGDFYAFFGTSVAAPQWSGLVALAAQMAGHRLGWLNPTIYRAAAGAGSGALFHDIRTGDNSVRYLDDSGAVRTIPGYRAAPGWDAVTGVGSPIASELVPLMAAAGKRQEPAAAGKR
jgi:subtilase family serine protease